MRPDLIEYQSTRQAVHSTTHPTDEQPSAKEESKKPTSTIALTPGEIDEAFASFEARQKRPATGVGSPPIDPRDAVSHPNDLGTLPRLDPVPSNAEETWNKEALVQAMREQLEALERQNSRLSQFLVNIKSTDSADLESAR